MKAALRNGYKASAGVLAVSIPPASFQLAKDAKPGQQLPFKTVLVDSRHRLHDLRFLRDNETEDGLDWKAITSRLEVRLNIHKQEIPVDNFMTIALGQRLNSSTNVSLPTKFRARIEAGINSLHCFAKDMNLEVRQLPIEECVKTILRSGNIGDLSRQTTTRSTVISLHLARCEALKVFFLRLCRKFEFLGLVHFQSPFLVNSDDEKMLLMMICLEAYAET